MKKVKCYMIRKPSDIQEVIEMNKKYPERAREISISEIIPVDKKTFNAICSDPLADYEFLSGKGGADDDGNLMAVEVVCAEFRGIMKSLIINPEGSSYCRYMGIA